MQIRIVPPFYGQLEENFAKKILCLKVLCLMSKLVFFLINNAPSLSMYLTI